MGARFHDAGHLLLDIDFALKTPTVKISSHETKWGRLEEEVLFRVVPSFRSFLRANLPSPTIDKLRELLDSLVWQVEHGRRTVDQLSLQIGGERLDSDTVASTISALRAASAEISVLVARVKKALLVFRISFKRLLNEVLNQYAENLQENEITVHRTYPEEACLAFGDEGSLKIILYNIIENVCRHSGANNLKIEVSKTSGGDLVAFFDDDGCGIQSPPKLGDGLHNAKQRADACSGKLTVRRLTQRDKRFGEGYRTRARLALVGLQTDIDA